VAGDVLVHLDEPPDSLLRSPWLLQGLSFRLAGEDLEEEQEDVQHVEEIDAASGGATVMSVLARSRWKSNMTNPAK